MPCNYSSQLHNRRIGSDLFACVVDAQEQNTFTSGFIDPLGGSWVLGGPETNFDSLRMWMGAADHPNTHDSFRMPAEILDAGRYGS